MDVNYEYYRVFYYAAAYGNFTLAADVLHSSQPNVSRAIRLLEEALGCKLFVRSNRGITLTPEGEQLYAHVKLAVWQLQAAEEELKQIMSLQAGVVSVGASETALHLLLLPALQQFQKMHPKIRVRIQNHLTSQAIASVRQGNVDFAVVASPADIQEPLKGSPLMEFQDILIGGKRFQELSESPVSLHEIQEYPLVCLGEHTMSYRFYSRFYCENGLLLKPEFEAATTDQILPMVRGDLGLGFCPKKLAQEALEAGEACQIELKETIPTRQIYLVEEKGRPLAVAAGALKRLLLDYRAQEME